VNEGPLEAPSLREAVNKIKAGIVKRISTSNLPFKKMENITRFTDAARMLGVPESAMFGTPDLFEEKNMGSVIDCVRQFAGVIQTTVPEYTGPKLGRPIQAKVLDKARDKTMPTQTGGLAGTLEQQPIFTGKRDAASHASPGMATYEPCERIFTSGGVDCKIDADLKAKMEEKIDKHAEEEVCYWISKVTGSSMGDQSMAEWLKDGQVLCALANKIKPGSIQKVNKQSIAYMQMENLKLFLDFMRGCGMPESSMFSTPDLFEEKGMDICVMSLYTFAGVVQVRCPEFEGPHIGIAVVAQVKDESRGLALVTDQSEAMQRHMELERPKDSAIILVH